MGIEDPWRYGEEDEEGAIVEDLFLPRYQHEIVQNPCNPIMELFYVYWINSVKAISLFFIEDSGYVQGNNSYL